MTETSADQIMKLFPAEAQLHKPELAGFIYPSRNMSGNGDSIALFPKHAGEYLVPERLEWARIIGSPETKKISLGIFDIADSFLETGVPTWMRGAG